MLDHRLGVSRAVSVTDESLAYTGGPPHRNAMQSRTGRVPGMEAVDLAMFPPYYDHVVEHNGRIANKLTPGSQNSAAIVGLLCVPPSYCAQ
jgi:hypothetical protein